MSPLVLAAGLPLLDPFGLVRVDDPDHPDRISGTETSSVLPGPPEPGVPWRWEPVAEEDGVATSAWPSNEAVPVTNADLWHADGITGEGVKVAVFDSGWFAPLAGDTDFAADLETHDCWLHPSCADPIDFARPRLGHEVSVHGFGCAQTVLAVAPGVELHLVRTSSLAGLENAVKWAIREDIDVISMSISYFNDTFYDGGPGTYDGMLRDLEAHDILLVNSSGNHARKHWVGSWKDVDHDGRMDFDGENHLEVDLPTDPVIYVNWNQHARCGDTDLRARLVDGEGFVYAVADALQDPDGDQCQPVEVLRPRLESGGVYRLEVSRVAGVEADLRIDIETRNGEVVHPIPTGAFGDPPSHPLTFSVAAVRAEGYLSNPPESFSSWGPNNAGHPKPDIAGPDGLTVDAYGPVGFFGTSASAPAVAGLIALLLQDDPSLTPRDAARKLQSLAWKGDALGDPDPRFGAGKARLPVRHPGDLPCGGRPLLAFLFLPPWGWFRRRSREAGVGCPTTRDGAHR